jgi:TonB family protein
MLYRRLFMFVFAFLAISPFGSAEEVISVDAHTLNQHVDYRVSPVYPPIAKAARVQGTVVIQIQVGTTGKVESMQVVSGPAMLRQAAKDCLKQWTYHPFVNNGKPVVATGPVSLNFVLSDSTNTTIGQGPQTKVSGESTTGTSTGGNAASGPNAGPFEEADGACKKGILAKQVSDATVSLCQQAAMLVDKLPLVGNYVAKRSAFVYAATAYADVGDLQSALPWAAKAVQIVGLGHDDDSGSNAAFSAKGTIEGLLGDLPSADRDLAAAEEFSRKGIARVEKEAPNQREEYVRPYVRDLRFHAKVLDALNRPDDAQKKLDEAAKYE